MLQFFLLTKVRFYTWIKQVIEVSILHLVYFTFIQEVLIQTFDLKYKIV